MSVVIPSFFWNNATQRILSQSNNVSYAARGVYRVYDTQDSRKGDYWFRDFGMVMACSYMTELGFRAVEKWYTIPLITRALGLNQLSEMQHAGSKTAKSLYYNPRNYAALPEIARERLMGTLIRNSSDLVPKLMKELELRQGGKLGDIAEDVKQCLSRPTEDAYHRVQGYLQKHGLQAHAENIQNISGIENQARRQAAIQELLSKHPNLKAESVQNAVKLEDARQMGILMDHLHRSLNFKEYLQENYLNRSSKLSSCVGDLLSSHWERMADLHEKGKKELPGLLKEIYDLPSNKRAEALNKQLGKYRNMLYLKNGVALVPKPKLDEFNELARQMQTALASEQKEDLKGVIGKVENFYKGLAHPDVQAHTLNQFWDKLAPELKRKIGSRVEAMIDDVRKLSPDKDRHLELQNKFQSLKFDQQHPELQQKLDNLLKTLQQESHMPKSANQPVTEACRENIKAALKQFVDELPNTREDLLKPFVKHLPSAEEFKRMIVDGMKSKTVVELIGKTQKNGTWPKMAATVLLNLIFYGWAASNFDNKILQPYQQKLVAERGTSQDIVNAGYLGLIPGAAVLTQLVDKTSLPVFRKMSYFGRFATVGGGALAAFAGGTYLILQQLVKQPPKHKQQTAAAPSPVYRPGMGLSGNYASPFANATMTGAMNGVPFQKPGFTTAFSPSPLGKAGAGTLPNGQFQMPLQQAFLRFNGQKHELN